MPKIHTKEEQKEIEEILKKVEAQDLELKEKLKILFDNLDNGDVKRLIEDFKKILKEEKTEEKG